MATIYELKIPNSLFAGNKPAADFRNSNLILPQCYHAERKNGECPVGWEVGTITNGTNTICFDFSKYTDMMDENIGFPYKSTDSFTVLAWVNFCKKPNVEEDTIKSTIFYQGCYLLNTDFEPYWSLTYNYKNDNSSKLRLSYKYSDEDIIIDFGIGNGLYIDNWFRIGIVHDAHNRNIKLYLDNPVPLEVPEVDYNSTLEEGIFYPLIIGGSVEDRGGNFQRSNCKMSCVSIYKTALPDELMNIHYNNGNALSYDETPDNLKDSLIAFWELSEREEDEDAPFAIRRNSHGEDSTLFDLTRSTRGSFHITGSKEYILFETADSESELGLLSSEGPLKVNYNEIEHFQKIPKLMANIGASTVFKLTNEDAVGIYDRAEEGLYLLDNRLLNTSELSVAIYPKYTGTLPLILDATVNKYVLTFKSIIKESNNIQPLLELKNDSIEMAIILNSPNSLLNIKVTVIEDDSTQTATLNLYALPAEREIKIQIEESSIAVSCFGTQDTIYFLDDNLITLFAEQELNLSIANHQVFKCFKIEKS